MWEQSESHLTSPKKRNDMKPTKTRYSQPLKIRSNNDLFFAVVHESEGQANIIARFSDYRDAKRFQEAKEVWRQNASTDDDGAYYVINR